VDRGPVVAVNSTGDDHIQVEDWVVVGDAIQPWFGVVREKQKDGQIVVHAYEFSLNNKPGTVLPVWRDDGARETVQRWKPIHGGFRPSEWITSTVSVLWNGKRPEPYALPLPALRAYAAHKRDPHSK
jgi:hypothetical protein